MLYVLLDQSVRSVDLPLLGWNSWFFTLHEAFICSQFLWGG